MKSGAYLQNPPDGTFLPCGYIHSIKAGQCTEVVLNGLLAHFSLASEIVQEALYDILIGQEYVLVLANQESNQSCSKTVFA